MVAAVAIHYPKPEHVEEWAEVMRQYSGASAGRSGFVDSIGYREQGTNRLVGISRWEDEESLNAVLPSAIEGASQLDAKWGERPTEVLVLRSF